MASKNNLRKKRIEAQRRRLPPKEKLKVDNLIVKFNKNGDLVYSNVLNKKKQSKSIQNEYNEIDFLIDEYNKNKDNYSDKLKKDVIKDINNQTNVIRNIKKSENNIQNIKSKKHNYKSNVEKKDVIISKRLQGTRNINNTYNIDNEVKKIAFLLNENFDFVLDFIFPHFEENSNYYELMAQMERQKQAFDDYILQELNNGNIDEETYNNILLCLNNIENL